MKLTAMERDLAKKMRIDISSDSPEARRAFKLAVIASRGGVDLSMRNGRQVASVALNHGIEDKSLDEMTEQVTLANLDGDDDDGTPDSARAMAKAMEIEARKVQRRIGIKPSDAEARKMRVAALISSLGDPELAEAVSKMTSAELVADDDDDQDTDDDDAGLEEDDEDLDDDSETTDRETTDPMPLDGGIGRASLGRAPLYAYFPGSRK